jgi:hypothetical protein
MLSVVVLLACTTLGAALALLVFAVVLLRDLNLRGGQDLALAHLAANGKRRRVFLSGLYASLAALFAMGLASSVETILGESSLVLQASLTTLFLVGSAGIFVLMTDAFRPHTFTLQEKWNLEETAQRGSMYPEAPLVGPASEPRVGTIGSDTKSPR